jgi:ferredoxin-NADP reductase
VNPLLNAVLPPPVFDFWAGKLNPLWSWQRPLARIIARKAEARDTVTLTLQANRHFQGFAAGQHVNVSVEIDGKRHTRSYSPSQVAGQPGRLTITVKRVAGGKVSGWLCAQAEVGSIVELGDAYGEMTPAMLTAPALFLAAGSGITPFISLIRAQAALGMPQPIALLYWAGTQDELCFVPELQALAAAHPGFTVHFLLTRAGDGRISLGQLQAHVPGLAATRFYACGPQGFVDTAEQLAGGLGRPFRGEAFSTPVITFEPGQLVSVYLSRSRRTVQVAAGQPLLEALEAQGLRPASGCRRGICNTCACGKAGGTSRNLLSGDTDSEATPGLRICISSAQSDLTLAL